MAGGGRAGLPEGARVGAWFRAGPGTAGAGRDGEAKGQVTRVVIRSQAAATSPDQAHPGGIFRMRLRAWWTIRAGADRTR